MQLPFACIAKVAPAFCFNQLKIYFEILVEGYGKGGLFKNKCNGSLTRKVNLN